MNIDLKGKVVVVTGGNRGLGKEMGTTLAGAGASVAFVDIVEPSASAEAVNKAGGMAKGYQADLTKEEDVLKLAKNVAADFGGKVHILINSAGINIRKPCVDFSFDDWNNVINCNLTSAFLMCRSFIPLMKGHGYGRIINMTSMLAHIALPGRVPYCSTKAGLLGMTRVLALELAEEAITVNGISPGPIGTEMNTPVMNDPVANAEFVKSIPLGRWGKPEEVGQLALYLCSEPAGYITGTDIVIDGGWSTR